MHPAPPFTELRVLRAKELPALARLCRQTFRETYETATDPLDVQLYMEQAFGPEVLEHAWLSGGSTFQLLWCGSQALGYLQSRLAVPDGHPSAPPGLELERLYLLQRFQGKGLGRRLLEAAIAQARQRQLGYLWLSVWKRNAGAIGFYRHAGFRKAGETPFLLGRQLQFDDLMRLDLPEAPGN